MQTLTDVHQQFAEFFKNETLKPFAYQVSKKLTEGHICLNLNELTDQGEDFPFSYATVEEMEAMLINIPLVSLPAGGKQPFILHHSRLYIQRYFAYETIILNRIREFALNENRLYAERAAQVEQHRYTIQQLFLDNNATDSSLADQEQIDWQLAAALLGVIHNFSIITGGPGTGKTTIVAKLLGLLYAIHPTLKVALAAPTGKAANRMAESLKNADLNIDTSIKEKFQDLQPSTLHRLLKPKRDSPYFEYNRKNTLTDDVVIVDEASMIDVALFAKLLDAIGPHTRIILLGDKDQLASVEAGSLLGDLCQTQLKANALSEKKVNLINSFIPDRKRQINHDFIRQGNTHPLAERIIELKKSYRFSSDEGIGRLSKAIINNDIPSINSFLSNNDDDQVRIDRHYSPAVFENFVIGYEQYILEQDIKLALQKFNKLKILCAVREGPHGLQETNEQVEEYLKSKGLLHLNAEYYLNRPLIITQNHYDLGLFNGDIGIIRPDKNGILKAWFEDHNRELKSVIPASISESETVFAMTIHKSQGSEYDQVLAILPEKMNLPLLTRELLYTAITRAKSSVIIQASEAVIMQTANGQVKRASGIMDRFDES